MATSVRTMDIIVPNREGQDVDATLRIESIDAGTIAGVALEGDRLDIFRFGILDDPCARLNDEGELSVELRITIPANHDTTIRVVVEADDQARGSAAFVISDERHGEIVGGVTLVCTNPPYSNDFPSEPTPLDQCPLVLDQEVYAVQLGNDPTVPTTRPPSIPGPDSVELVAVIRNAGADEIHGATIYVEHTGGGGLIVVPQVWHLGNIESQAKFWATWTVSAATAIPGSHEMSFVAACEGHSPVRLPAQYVVRDNRG